eukprot:s219_g9.t4
MPPASEIKPEFQMTSQYRRDLDQLMEISRRVLPPYSVEGITWHTMAEGMNVWNLWVKSLECRGVLRTSTDVQLQSFASTLVRFSLPILEGLASLCHRWAPGPWAGCMGGTYQGAF